MQTKTVTGPVKRTYHCEKRPPSPEGKKRPPSPAGKKPNTTLCFLGDTLLNRPARPVFGHWFYEPYYHFGYGKNRG